MGQSPTRPSMEAAAAGTHAVPVPEHLALGADVDIELVRADHQPLEQQHRGAVPDEAAAERCSTREQAFGGRANSRDGPHQSLSISPRRSPPSLLRPSVGCRVSTTLGPRALACILSRTMCLSFW